MLGYVLRRLASAVAVLFVVSVLTFLMFEALPNGNPAVRLAGRTATPAIIAAVAKQYGFNQPLYVQYLRTMEQIFTGQIISYQYHTNVDAQLLQDLPVTASLILGAYVIWISMSIVLGLLAGYRAGGKLDALIAAINFTGISAPVYVVGYLLIYLFAFVLHIFPASGYVSITSNPLSWAWHLVMPWSSLAILYIGVYAQVLRSSVVDVLDEDYVRTARAKGLSRLRVALRHVLRNSLMPIVALSGLDIAGILGGGAILTEIVFDLPGVGNYVGTSVAALDVTPVLVFTMFGAFAVVLFSAVADIVYAVLDPRVRVLRS